MKANLDIREINGYSIHYTAFHPAASPSEPIRTLVYIGTPDNDQFTGPQDIQALAEHIHRSEGPSGLNSEYLLHLDAALRDLSPGSGDRHVTDLSERVRAIIAARDWKATTPAANGHAVTSAAVSSKVESANDDEQEETEKPSDP